MTGNDIAEEAFRRFAAWLREHDPEGEMPIWEAAEAYNKWCDEHSNQTSAIRE